MPGPFTTGSDAARTREVSSPRGKSGANHKLAMRRTGLGEAVAKRGPKSIADVAWGIPRAGTASAWRRIALGSAPAGIAGGCRPSGPLNFYRERSLGKTVRLQLASALATQSHTRPPRQR